ncbi:hypothetical protein [Acidovorax delafieldii]|uniref:hypothetical protein n=1 Tax=Acidovorax delafieldii TaxID=47920 RepID=UPI0013158BC4|nr:hypothetical protein [Acidovorax delafieldii]
MNSLEKQALASQRLLWKYSEAGTGKTHAKHIQLTNLIPAPACRWLHGMPGDKPPCHHLSASRCAP